tara:strand:+ start:484 stop:654 length:171 start_codon:yes stop_codon:yes gene_type:complete
LTNSFTGVFPVVVINSKVKIFNRLLNLKSTFIKAGIFLSLAAYWGIILVGTFITFN